MQPTRALMIQCFLAASLVASAARAGPATEPDAAVPETMPPDAVPVGPQAEEGSALGDYTRRIREAVEPLDVRRACNSRTGSYATDATITVCGEALGQNRYRVPREVAVAPKAEDMKSPVDKGRALMKAGDGGPVGNTADLGGTGFNPLMLGVVGYKVVEKLIENAREE